MTGRFTWSSAVRRSVFGLLLFALVFGLVPASAAQDGRTAPSPGDHAEQPAEPSSDLAALSLEQLLTIDVESVFGASRYLQRVTEAPTSVTIITADEIARYGYRTLSDALRMVRGFYVNNDRSYDFIGIRGFQRPADYNTHVLILLDGHRANDNVYGQGDLGEGALVTMEEIDRIEVIRGPSSSMYGNSAFFGVVNIVTRRGRDVNGAAVTSEGGSFGRRSVEVLAGRPFGQDGGFSVSAEAARSDGARDLYYPEFDQPSNHFGVARDLDYADRQNVRASLDVGGLSVQGGWNRRRKGVPTGAYGMVFNDPRAFVQDSWGYADITWNRRWTPAFGLNLRGFYDDYRYLGVEPFESVGNGTAPFTVENRDVAIGRWWGAEARLSGDWTRHRWTAGVEYRRNVDQVQKNVDVSPSLTYLDDHRTSGTGGVYVQDDIRLSQVVSASLGLRGDVYSDFSNPITPRLALIVTPAKMRTFKLLYGEAFRAPTVYETYYAYGPYKANPRLQPERIRTLEFAWEEYVSPHVRLGANTFRYAVRNLVGQVTDPSDGLLVYRNTDEMRAIGAEFEAEVRWNGGLQARGSYAWQRATDAISGSTLVNSPAHVAQAAVSAPLGTPRVIASLTLQGLSARVGKDGSVPGYVLPGLTVLTSAVEKRLTIRLSVNNLLNRMYADPAADELRQIAIPQDGRAVFLQASWRFQ
jgi:outer membrane receptor protein involved in Fe transport